MKQRRTNFGRRAKPVQIIDVRPEPVADEVMPVDMPEFLAEEQAPRRRHSRASLILLKYAAYLLVLLAVSLTVMKYVGSMSISGLNGQWSEFVGYFVIFVFAAGGAAYFLGRAFAGGEREPMEHDAG